LVVDTRYAAPSHVANQRHLEAYGLQRASALSRPRQAPSRTPRSSAPMFHSLSRRLFRRKLRGKGVLLRDPLKPVIGARPGDRVAVDVGDRHDVLLKVDWIWAMPVEMSF